jgi:glycosyltransferase involved in cell wall biosynthesis
MTKYVSIIVPIRNEEAYIEKTIDSIFEQDYGSDNFEVILVDGMSDDATLEKIESLIPKYPNIKLFHNSNKVVPFALNIAIKESLGEVIVRLDAHSFYPNNYISELVKKLTELNAWNVGGVFDTLPANGTTKAYAIAEALKSPISVGDSYHRIGGNEVMEVDTVPYGCFKKEVFGKIGLFDEQLVRNQDDEFNSRILKNGGKIYILPYLKIEYFARPSIRKTAKMFYQYGLFKPLVVKKIGKLTSIRQLVPVAFLMGLVVGILLSFVHEYFFVVYTAVITIYAILLLFTAFRLFLRKKQASMLAIMFYLPFTIFLIHVSYGMGYIVGLLKINDNGYWNIKANLKTNR